MQTSEKPMQVILIEINLNLVKVSVDDMSVLNDSTEDIITLVTCVRDQPAYRWCVQARAKI